MKSMQNIINRIVAILVLASFAGCGIFLTELPPDNEILDGPIADLTPSQLHLFLKGDEEFGRKFTPGTGLGPVFNNSSCASCHTDDGKGHPSTALTRFGVGDPLDATKFDYLINLGGPQLQEKAIPGYVGEKIPPLKGLVKSVRTGPIVSGLGLIDFIPDEEILKYSDPDDKDKDGISGRPNWVKPPEWFIPNITNVVKDGKMIGRFGRKATSINVFQQVVGAYFNDMGLTTDFIPNDLFNPIVGKHTGDIAPDPEVPAEVVHSVTFYIRALRPPERRDENDPTVKKGEELFKKVGCAKCHVPEMKTGDSAIKALSNKVVKLYSDMLLHDMGEELADNYPEGSATGKEWRTTPLWGVGVIQNLLGGERSYLHDGRAKTLQDAIKFHGGESKASREAFNKLSKTDQDALIKFLESL